MTFPLLQLLQREVAEHILPFCTDDDLKRLACVSSGVRDFVYAKDNKKIKALWNSVPEKYKREYKANLNEAMEQHAMRLDANFDPIVSNPPNISSAVRLQLMLNTPVHQMTQSEFNKDLLLEGPYRKFDLRYTRDGHFSDWDDGSMNIHVMDPDHFIVQHGDHICHIWSMPDLCSKGEFILSEDEHYCFARGSRASFLDDGALLLHGIGGCDNDLVLGERTLHLFRKNESSIWQEESNCKTGFRHWEAFDTVKYQGELWYAGTDRVRDLDGVERLYVGKVNTSDGLSMHEIQTIDLGQQLHRPPWSSTDYVKVSICNNAWLAVNSLKHGLVLYNLENGTHQVTGRRLFGNADADGDILYTSGLYSAVCRCKVMGDGTLEQQSPEFKNIENRCDRDSHYGSLPMFHVDFHLQILLKIERYPRWIISVYHGLTGNLLYSLPIEQPPRDWGCNPDGVQLALLPGMGYVVWKLKFERPKFFLLPSAKEESRTD